MTTLGQDAAQLGQEERNALLIGGQNGSGTGSPMRILQVSAVEKDGGAEKVAWDLFQAYLARGCASWLAVGHKTSDHPGVFAIPEHQLRKTWRRFWLGVSRRINSLDRRVPGALCLGDFAEGVAEPYRWANERRGRENFHFPATGEILRLPPEFPHILHLHNLHGNYFDLRSLPWLTQRLPTVLTLHDAWLLSGHCAHSFDCERWKTGCGQCPDLNIYPAIRRDATAYNWRRKREIFSRSRFYVATPSRWLMQKVKQSILAPAIKESKVIPYGIDLGLFRPASKLEARAALGLPQGCRILLFTANGIRKNVFKDYKTLQTAISLVAEHLDMRDVVFLALGEDGPAEQVGRAKIRFIPYQKDPTVVARYYQAADVYLHAARADTFPNTVLEALACGTPVVATAVGGISEQVKGLKIPGGSELSANLNRYRADAATGVLVPPADPMAIAVAVEQLLKDHSIRARLGENAVRDAKERFDLQTETDRYLDWYRELLEKDSLQLAESTPAFFS